MGTKVFTVNSNAEYDRMFLNEGWTKVNTIKEADLIQFTGGEDVSPELYKQKRHPKTKSNMERDKREAIIFSFALTNNIPMVGICRGGQFLNVMCGGELWQDVDGHARGGTHEVIDLITGDSFRATSTHHQMMISGPGGIIIGAADESKFRSSVLPNGHIVKYHIKKLNEYDTEIVFYKNQRALCFQPHPEYAGVPDLKVKYFMYIRKYLFSSGRVKKV